MKKENHLNFLRELHDIKKGNEERYVNIFKEAKMAFKNEKKRKTTDTCDNQINKSMYFVVSLLVHIQ